MDVVIVIANVLVTLLFKVDSGQSLIDCLIESLVDLGFQHTAAFGNQRHVDC